MTAVTLALLAACSHHSVPTPVAPVPVTDLATTIFLLGDAGSPHLETDPNLAELTKQATESPVGSIILFLGDNLYPSGLPDTASPNRAEAERRLEAQLAVARISKRRAIFVPGNHDWERWGTGGEAAIKRAADYLRDRVPGLSRQLPDSACPGPVTVDVGIMVRLVLLDTQWWLHNFSKPYGGTSKCSATNETQVIDQLAATLEGAGKRHVIVAGHHPLASGGEHGGYFSFGKHLFPLRGFKRWLWIPIPILGSIYPIARMNGITSQDLSNSRNEFMRSEFGRAFAKNPPILYAAGHDHNLQVFHGPYAKYSIVSGSGIIDHQEATRYKDSTLYAARKPGFMRFDVTKAGKVRLSVQVIDQSGPAESFAIWLTEP